MSRIAIIGYGAITEEIISILQCREDDTSQPLVGVLVRPARLAAATSQSAGRFFVTASLDELLDRRPTCVVECASHSAVAEHGPAVLSRGTDLLLASVGALADPDIAATLLAAARTPARLLVPSGAVAGLDGLLAARTAGLSSVTYTSVKPPPAWRGTPGEAVLAAAAGGGGGGLAGRTVLFEGPAREAARLYPRNANVAVAVALASGLGPDRARVRLVADPAAAGPLGVVEAAGRFGALRLETLALASPGNPKTSALTAHSLLAAALHGVACFPADPALLLPAPPPPPDAAEAAAAASAYAALAALALGVPREGAAAPD